MLKIVEGEPWVMWPNNLVDNFIDFPSNKIFDQKEDFDFTVNFSFDNMIARKSTLFSKLPSYTGIDIEPNGLLLILSLENMDTQYIFADYSWEVGVEYKLSLSKRGNNLLLLINDITLLTTQLITPIKGDEESHIIFGAGNFPKNGFNLNYFGFNLIDVEIKKEGKIISKHIFNEFIHNKSLDITGNCNFIYKI